LENEPDVTDSEMNSGSGSDGDGSDEGRESNYWEESDGENSSLWSDEEEFLDYGEMYGDNAEPGYED
jgi:hypothetical protein